MSFKYVKVGDRISLTDRSKGREMASLVEGVPEPGELLIRAPVVNGGLAVISDNSVLIVVIFTEKGIIKFDANVIENLKEDGFRLLHVKLLGEGERIQRREYFRMDCKTPFLFNQIKDYGQRFIKETAIPGMVQDISGGGIRFVSDHLLSEDEMVKGVIELEDENALVSGKILEIQNILNSNTLSYKYQYRVQFINVPDKAIETITRYIFNRQRKQLQLQGNKGH
jgi:c-di-GMP-binding flagellar brake protein YcgR